MDKTKTQDHNDSKMKVRLVISGTKVAELERVCTDIKRSATQRELHIKGPVRLPTKVLHITTRRSPCGEGTNTWDRFQMRIHKRLIDIESSPEVIKDITSVSIDPSVQVEVILKE